jgi:hypothetical protein
VGLVAEAVLAAAQRTDGTWIAYQGADQTTEESRKLPTEL